MTEEWEWCTMWRHMRTPLLACATLLVMLAAIVLLGVFQPFHSVYLLEVALTAGMVLTVLLLSMGIGEEPPLHRFYAGLGFFWVAILMSMTVIDYLTR